MMRQFRILVGIVLVLNDEFTLRPQPASRSVVASSCNFRLVIAVQECRASIQSVVQSKTGMGSDSGQTVQKRDVKSYS